MSFPHFTRLPTELRFKIWQYMLPNPRVVDVFACAIDEALEERLTPNSCTQDPGASSWVLTYVERVYTERQRLPALFHVCRDTRKLVLQHYIPCSTETGFQGERKLEKLAPEVRDDKLDVVYSRVTLKGNQPFALLSPMKDIVFLQDPVGIRSSIGGPVGSSLAPLVRWLSSEIKANLRSLAIPYYTWRKARNAGALPLLMEFERLEGLYLSFMSGNNSAMRRNTWSDEVGGVDELGGHMKEVKEEVMGDIEDLARAYPQWKYPVVRVVKNKEMLVSECEM